MRDGALTASSPSASSRRTSHRAITGNTSAESTPARSRAAAVAAVMRFASSPMAVAVTTNGSDDVDASSPATPRAAALTARR